MLLFFGLYTVGKILIHEIRETPVLPAVPADIFFAGEKYAAEENIVFVFGFVILHILCCKILVGEVWESSFPVYMEQSPRFVA
jgi:hypothetical protein